MKNRSWCKAAIKHDQPMTIEISSTKTSGLFSFTPIIKILRVSAFTIMLCSCSSFPESIKSSIAGKNIYVDLPKNERQVIVFHTIKERPIYDEPLNINNSVAYLTAVKFRSDMLSRHADTKSGLKLEFASFASEIQQAFNPLFSKYRSKILVKIVDPSGQVLGVSTCNRSIDASGDTLSIWRTSPDVFESEASKIAQDCVLMFKTELGLQ